MIYIALGSNIGKREEYILKALQFLEEKCIIIKKSSLYETEAVSSVKQGMFLNAVIKVKTDLQPSELLNFLLSVEKKLGRVRTVKNGPRIVDLDILFYGNKIVNNENLKIPHPRLEQRKFILQPLKEISPEVVHPVLKKSVLELFSELESREVVNLYKKTF